MKNMMVLAVNIEEKPSIYIGPQEGPLWKSQDKKCIKLKWWVDDKTLFNTRP